MNLPDISPIYTLPFHQTFLMFLIFSFVGWCSEVVYVGILSEHKFVNRGFLHGPICPIYGFGGVVILLLPQQLYHTWLPLFLGSMILCTAVEYIASWILEKMFRTLWWDYSHYKFNLKGRVCLLNSVLFGIMGLLAIHFVIPFVMYFLNSFSDMIITNAAHILMIILIIDILVTIKRLVDFNTTMEKIKSFGDSLVDHYGHEEWFHGESISEMMESVKAYAAVEKDKVNQNILEKIEKLQTMRHANVESFLRRFPTLKSMHYKDSLNLIKHKIKNNLKEIKK